MKTKMRGFSLLELMVVVGIMVLLASIAIPGYQRYVQRANRSDATNTLLRIASSQEKFFLQNNTYTTNFAQLGLNNVSENGHYNIALAANAAGLVVGFTATAAPAATSGQLNDATCQSFTLDQAQTRTALDGGAVDQTARCWGGKN